MPFLKTILSYLLPPFYHKPKPVIFLLSLLDVITKMKFTTELNNPTAVEKLQFPSKRPNLYE